MGLQLNGCGWLVRGGNVDAQLVEPAVGQVLSRVRQGAGSGGGRDPDRTQGEGGRDARDGCAESVAPAALSCLLPDVCPELGEGRSLSRQGAGLAALDGRTKQRSELELDRVVGGVSVVDHLMQVIVSGTESVTEAVK
ncbi:hypothetical protein [Nocardioides allogilvus]|uniref:hypothetical protein n=1 Tax=Nocardioides allogilvus TaxID=2072017 RepID=UPI000D316B7B|nr:hypothetical protein [Nocardioides allogilvus]